MPVGLPREVEDEVVRRIRLLEAVERDAVPAEAHSADPRDRLSGGEAEELALRAAGRGHLEELFLVVVDEIVAFGEHAVEGTAAAEILLVDRRREVHRDDRLLQDHRPATDPTEPRDPPDGLLPRNSERLRHRRTCDALRDAEETRLDRAAGAPGGQRREKPAGAAGLAQDPAAGHERANALVALHAARALELVERAADGDQAHPRHAADLLPARK